MFRRIVSLLMVTVVFASQLATMPHVHGATSQEQQENHDAIPHFHWHGHCSHCGSHSHGDDGHHHPGRQNGPAESHPIDHDSDAVYLVGGVDFIGPSTTQLTAIQSVFAAPALPAVLPTNGVEALTRFEARWRPPDQVLDDSDAYLTLRTLRI